MNKKIKALVVDDDEDICIIVSNQLKKIGHESDCAHDYETAMELFKNKKYDYVLLDMEIPFRPGGASFIEGGMQALATIRSKYDRDQLPVIVFTSKLNSQETAGPICKRCVKDDVNDIILKSELNLENHIFEKTILDVLGNKSGIPKMLSESREWLFRIPSEVGSKMTWRTRAKNGYERSYVLDVGTIRSRLLDCIFRSLDKGNVISEIDLITASRYWNKETYSPAGVGASRGPMKNHASFFRTKLGMKITFVPNGIKVEQPDE